LKATNCFLSIFFSARAAQVVDQLQEQVDQRIGELLLARRQQNMATML
jgi:hypothetical protein